MLNLDEAQARYEQGQFSSNPAIAFAAIDDVPALITEARVSRKIVERLKFYRNSPMKLAPSLERLLDEWDAVVNEVR